MSDSFIDAPVIDSSAYVLVPERAGGLPRYWAETDQDNRVLRVIVCDDPDWPAANLGGTWVETGDPYGLNPLPALYPALGMGCDPSWPESFAPDWVQPTGAQDAYPKDSLVFYNGRIWKSLQDANVFEPGVASWRDVPPTGFPIWVQPTGAQDAWPIDSIVEWEPDGTLWKSTVNANVWPPTGEGAFGWVQVNPDGTPYSPPVTGPQPWAPWNGVTFPYQIGTQVTHNGQTWESTIANNTWEPGVFGWVVV